MVRQRKPAVSTWPTLVYLSFVKGGQYVQQLLGYFTQGIRVQKFINSSVKAEGATNNFPEIAYDLLTNRRYGIGEYVGKNALDEDAFNVAASSCAAYRDGVISSKANVRSFLFTQAAYQMLDFTIKGGPSASTQPSRLTRIKRSASQPKRATPTSQSKPSSPMAMSGRLRRLPLNGGTSDVHSGTQVQKEEKNGFPETVTRIRLADDQGGYDRDPIETFDMTQFCTSRDHAIAFGKFAFASAKKSITAFRLRPHLMQLSPRPVITSD